MGARVVVDCPALELSGRGSSAASAASARRLGCLLARQQRRMRCQQRWCFQQRQWLPQCLWLSAFLVGVACLVSGVVIVPVGSGSGGRVYFMRPAFLVRLDLATCHPAPV